MIQNAKQLFFPSLSPCLHNIIVSEQKKKLLELKDYMIKTIFADNYCAEGCIITINGILELHQYVKKHFDLPSLMTSHVDQDYVEGAFKDIRADSRHSDPKLIIPFRNSAI